MATFRQLPGYFDALDPTTQIMIAWPNIRKMLRARGYDVSATPIGVGADYVERALLGKNRGRLVFPRADEARDGEGKPVRRVVGTDRNGGPLLSLPKERMHEIPQLEESIREDERRRLGERIAVSFLTDDKVGVGAVRTLEAWMRESGVTRGIIFACGRPTPMTHQELRNLKGMMIEVLWYKRYAFELPAHYLIPPHRVFTSRVECESLPEMLHTPMEKLPRQTKDEALTSYYGLLPGDVVRYMRPDGVYYRVVSKE